MAEATAPYRTPDATAGVLRTVASAAQLVTGPWVGLAIAAVSEAGIAAIASHAAVSAMGDDAPPQRRKEALAYVIAQVEYEELCEPLVAHAWRFAAGIASGARRDAFPAEWARPAAGAVAGAAVARALRKNAVGRVLRIALLADLVRVGARARNARHLIARARHHAIAYVASPGGAVEPNV
jgi:hypothetical protein